MIHRESRAQIASSARSFADGWTRRMQGRRGGKRRKIARCGSGTRAAGKKASGDGKKRNRTGHHVGAMMGGDKSVGRQLLGFGGSGNREESFQWVV